MSRNYAFDVLSLKRVQAILILLVALSSGCIYREQLPLSSADVIIVLGNTPPVDDEGRPTGEIERRVEHGAELFARGLAEWIILTGGNTYEDVFECDIMAIVAKEQGMPSDQVVLERQSTDTLENASFCAALMKEQGWTSCMLVSRPHQLKRAHRHFVDALECNDSEVQTSGCETPEGTWYDLSCWLHEVGALLGEAARGKSRGVRGRDINQDQGAVR